MRRELSYAIGIDLYVHRMVKAATRSVDGVRFRGFHGNEKAHDNLDTKYLPTPDPETSSG
jgi:hypothetical protein